MRKRKKLWLQTALAAGVAALIAFGAYRAATADSTPQVPEYTVSTAYGYTMEALLPDGSRVWLNANSTLRYPAQFGDGDRAVHLSGEAYFSVSADATHPFRVHAHDITVTATGTQFNVNAYNISPCSSVTLVEGKVDVAAGGHIYSMNSRISEHNLRPHSCSGSGGCGEILLVARRRADIRQRPPCRHMQQAGTDI